MTPDQIKKHIRDEYIILLNRAEAGLLNKSAIYHLIKSRCLDGARHGGVVENWKMYMPDELKYEL